MAKIVFPFVFLLVLIFGVVFWKLNVNNQAPPKVEVPQNNNELSSKKSELENLLRDSLSPELKLNKQRNGMDYYQNIFFVDSEKNTEVVVQAIPYVKGLKIDEGYETLSWTNDLDRNLKNFKALKIGSQTAETLVVGGYKNREIILKKIGNRNWAMTDSVFSPSASFHRNYSTYDEANKRFIDVNYRVSIADKSKGVFEFTNKGEVQILSVPDEINKGALIIEEVLAKY